MNNKHSVTTSDWDVRVRERNLRSGRLSEKDVEKHLGALPDMADKADTLAIPQPALVSESTEGST